VKSPSLHSWVLGSRIPYRSSFDMAWEGDREGKVQTAAKANSQCGLVMSTAFQNGTEISIGDMEDTLWNMFRVPPTHWWVVAKHNQITCLQEGMEVTHFKFMERKTSYIITRASWRVPCMTSHYRIVSSISLGHS